MKGNTLKYINTKFLKNLKMKNAEKKKHLMFVKMNRYLLVQFT